MMYKLFDWFDSLPVTNLELWVIIVMLMIVIFIGREK